MEPRKVPIREPSWSVKRRSCRTPSAKTVWTKLQRIAGLAKEDTQRVLTSLAHHIDLEFLKEAYRRTRKNAAPGVDGQTAADYERHLDQNLSELLDRFKSGTYRAPPVKRAYIPKGNGKKRALGVPTLEDKVLQRAVTMVLSAVYEQDFQDCSYGSRPDRSAHQALGVLREGIREMQGGWVLDLDVQAFFDHLDHQKLREILDQRVRDGVLRRVTHKGTPSDGGLVPQESPPADRGTARPFDRQAPGPLPVLRDPGQQPRALPVQMARGAYLEALAGPAQPERSDDVGRVQEASGPLATS